MDGTQKKYRNSLKDKRWIKRREYILKKQGYKCSICESKINLCVHHKYYYHGTFTPAWEYPDDCLIVLCERCHEEHHENNNFIFKPKPIITCKKKKAKGKKGLIDRLMKEAVKAEKKIKNKYR